MHLAHYVLKKFEVNVLDSISRICINMKRHETRNMRHISSYSTAHPFLY